MSVTHRDHVSADTIAEASPPYASECPVCAAHRDPVTGNPRYRPEVYEGMQEVDDMLSGKIPSTLRRFKSVDEMFEDLDRDDSDNEAARTVTFYRTGSHSNLY